MPISSSVWFLLVDVSEERAILQQSLKRHQSRKFLYEPCHVIWTMSCDMNHAMWYEPCHVIWTMSCDMNHVMWYEPYYVIWTMPCDMNHAMWYEPCHVIWTMSCDMNHVMWFEPCHVIWTMSWDMNHVMWKCVFGACADSNGPHQLVHPCSCCTLLCPKYPRYWDKQTWQTL